MSSRWGGPTKFSECWCFRSWVCQLRFSFAESERSSNPGSVLTSARNARANSERTGAKGGSFGSHAAGEPTSFLSYY